MLQLATREGYQVDFACNGTQALHLFERNNYIAVFLEVMLPDVSGFEVCRRIRMLSQAPIIMVTSLSGNKERITGLDLGADDYVVKPFSPSEVMARLRAVLRRVTDFRYTRSGSLIRGSLKINLDTFHVFISGKRIILTKKEIEILLLLAAHTGIVFTRTQILDRIWDCEYHGDNRVVDTNIKRLWAKTDCEQHPDWTISTVRGFGYKFEMLSKED